MRYAERLKRAMYVAPRVAGNRVTTYGEPMRYMVNALTSQSTASVTAYGGDYVQRVTVCCDPRYASTVNELDAVYYDTTPPVETDELAEDADYLVESIVRGIDLTTIVLVRRKLGGSK